MLKELGAFVIDYDGISRGLITRGSEFYSRACELAVKRAFSSKKNDILDSSGSIDRRKLSTLVFEDETDKKRKRLNKIFHARVAKIALEIERENAQYYPIIIHSVPLLFEARLDFLFDTILLITTTNDIRLHRLIENRGIPSELAQKILDRQISDYEQADRSDFIIDSSNSLDEFRANVADYWNRINAAVK